MHNRPTEDNKPETENPVKDKPSIEEKKPEEITATTGFDIDKWRKDAEETNRLHAILWSSNRWHIYRRVCTDNKFRGDLTEYVENHEQLKQIDTIQLTGKQMRPNSAWFNSSISWSEKAFSQFMQAIDKMKVKSLSLKGCTTDAKIGEVIGEALKTNTSLEKLSVTDSNEGLVSIFKGLEENKSLKIFHWEGPNVADYRYYRWSKEEVEALKNLIMANKTLQKIVLLNAEQIMRSAEHGDMLREIYSSIRDRKLATIMFERPYFKLKNLAGSYRFN